MFATFTGCLFLFLLAVLLARPLGRYMARVYRGEKSCLAFIQPLEQWLFKFCGINPAINMSWKKYLGTLLVINGVWLIWAVVLLLLQGRLILNPAGNPSMEWTLALNSAVSFVTSTNLQHYSGETGATYLSQIGVFLFLQFLSAATSLCAGVAVVRGIAAGQAQQLGNFYQDLVWSITRILLPLSIIAAILFLFSSMPMTFDGPFSFASLQGDSSTVASGPVAAFVPIKELGSNGGGYFGANDAHPLENPDFFSFLLHSLIVFLLPMAFVFFIGRYLKEKQFAKMIFAVMTAGFLLVTIPVMQQEIKGNPLVGAMGIRNNAGNMEGKEWRFGAGYTAFYCGENVAIPAGTVAGMHDSFMPLPGAGMLLAMQIDAFYGGLGTGWINLFIYLVIAIFIATMMIGRTPEIFGKKIGIAEMQVAVSITVLQLLVPMALAAVATYVYLHYPGGNPALGWLQNKGSHGFTSILYEYVSSAAGNGSGFEGLGDNSPFWNLTTAIAMLTGRFVPIAGALMMAGWLHQKKYIPPSAGSLRIDSLSFGSFLLLVMLVLNALSLLPVLMAGPLSEYFHIH